MWALFAGRIVVISLAAALGELQLAAIVGIEVVILAANRWSCPLTAVAARCTEERRANFDTYLPEWLARYNKAICGTSFGAGLLLVLARWRGWL